MEIVKSDHHLHHVHHLHHHLHHHRHHHHHVGVFYVKIAVTASDKTNMITHTDHHNSHGHFHHLQREVSMKKHCNAMIMMKWQKLNLQL